MSKTPILSVIIAVYQGEALIDRAVTEIIKHFQTAIPDTDFELIAIDDGSADGSYARLVFLQKQYPQYLRVIRLSRNFGVFSVTQAGIDNMRGKCVVVIPQDLQDTPQMIVDMFHAWQNDNIKINLTTRTKERDEPFLKKMFASVYHKLFRLLAAVPGYPDGGLGMFLIDRQIADELKTIPMHNTDILVYLFSIGYSRRLHPYPRRRSAALKSNWTFTKKFKLAADNFIGFSYLPVRLMSAVGIVVAVGGFVFAGYVFVGKFTGWYAINQPPGWATIVVLITFLGGLSMSMLGVIGEYLWRILDAVRGHPRYLVDEIIDNDTPPPKNRREQI